MNEVRLVRVATSGRRFRTYVGRLPGGRRLPGGARPIEQVVGFTATGVLTIIAILVVPYNALAVFAVGLIAAFAVTAVLSLIKYDGVPVLGKTVRMSSLVFDRKPSVLAREELERQAASNPHAFVINVIDDARSTTADTHSTTTQQNEST
ncbi:hypothetical protein F0Q45_08345 [Mycobacterium simiae]|uniref:Uncharacterized protein n=1 Tax=Mycobacterium simiae TaxID=1784 RepID=A0A5B1BTR3_MYCSI|nr:hypothetical protein [Mycobacterium simiae]KAA1250694.1 hypothetical protein F0Q45_08345 [Mycobacterium simiae]